MNLEDLPRKHFACLLADPPWHFASNSTAKPGRNAFGHYDCIRLADIAALPVAGTLADDCGTEHDRDRNAALNILRVGLDALGGAHV